MSLSKSRSDLVFVLFGRPARLPETRFWKPCLGLANSLFAVDILKRIPFLVMGYPRAERRSAKKTNAPRELVGRKRPSTGRPNRGNDRGTREPAHHSISQRAWKQIP